MYVLYKNLKKLRRTSHGLEFFEFHQKYGAIRVQYDIF